MGVGAELMEITYLCHSATSVAWLEHTVAGICRFYQIRVCLYVCGGVPDRRGLSGRCRSRRSGSGIHRHLLKSRAGPSESRTITERRLTRRLHGGLVQFRTARRWWKTRGNLRLPFLFVCVCGTEMGGTRRATLNLCEA